MVDLKRQKKKQTPIKFGGGIVDSDPEDIPEAIVVKDNELIVISDDDTATCPE